MTTTITYENVRETGPHRFEADAAELGWRPGHWPQAVPTNLGNSLSLILTGLAEDRATYRQAAGCITVTVWND